MNRSLTPSVASELRLRGAWLAFAWLLVALVVYLSLTPHPPEIPLDEGDKYGHVAAYAALMFSFAQLYVGMPRARAAIGIVMLGVALEFVQASTGYRTFDVWDMAADAAGVACGLVVAPPRLPNVFAWLERMIASRKP